MTMVLDNSYRQHGGMGYDNMYSTQIHQHPQFTDPWAHTSSNSTSSIYPTSMGSSNMGLNSVVKPEPSRPTAISMPYSSIPVSAPSMVSSNNYSTAGYGGSDLLSLAQDLPRSTYATQSTYATSSPAASSFAPSNYSSLNYVQSVQQQQQHQTQDENRRLSSPHDQSSRTAQTSYTDALDASRGMVALSQTDLTPRNIYGPRSSRGSTDSYGFPSAHSSTSSISSTGQYPYYAGSVAGSVDSSVTDYSSAASDAGYDSMPSRTLPRPNGLLGANLPPAPQSMMGQFSSKLSSNTQKKHKCKVCDKRFTRPSSLQTHMYSHTGEKRKSHSSNQRTMI